MKKLLQLVTTILVLSFIIAGCAPAATATVAPAAPATEVPAAPATAAPAVAAPTEAPTAEVAAKKITIGFAAANSGWPWYATFIKTLDERAQKNGWDTIILSANGDVATQLNQVEDLISKKVDYLIVGPLDPKAVTPGLKDAQAAKIPVVIIGNDIDDEGAGYVAAIRIPDDRELGKNSAELMVEALKDSPSKKIFVVEGLAGQPAVLLRWESMTPIFKAAGIEVVAHEPADWDINKAIKVTEDLVTRYPKIDGVFSMDGSMTPGIVQVLDESGISVPVVGLGGTKTEVDLLKAGKIYGTACMSPAANASGAMDAIESLSKGETIEKRVAITTPKTTKENADSCPGDW
jgi:ribose transport system substrate-binding protein